MFDLIDDLEIVVAHLGKARSYNVF